MSYTLSDAERARAEKRALLRNTSMEEHAAAYEANVAARPPPAHNEEFTKDWVLRFLHAKSHTEAEDLSPCCGFNDPERTVVPVDRIRCGLEMCATRVPGKPFNHCGHCLYPDRVCTKEPALHAEAERARVGRGGCCCAVKPR